MSRSKIRIDNMSAISLIKYSVHHDRNKHIDVSLYFIRKCSQDGLIEVNFIRTDEQLGDVLTKPVCKIKF
jgi:hypothetical protein